MHENIEVNPLGYDFGDIEVGTSSTTIITISNFGDGVLYITDLAFQSGSSSDYEITLSPSLTAIIPPEQVADVEITYAPTAEGISSVILEIHSNDPEEPLVHVALSGTGIVVEVPPSEQVQIILDFFDESPICWICKVRWI